MTDLEAVNVIAQTAASDAVRALKQVAGLRAEMQSAYKTMFAIQVELLEAVAWLRRDGADQDDCERAKPHVERARELVDAVMDIATKADAKVPT